MSYTEADRLSENEISMRKVSWLFAKLESELLVNGGGEVYDLDAVRTVSGRVIDLCGGVLAISVRQDSMYSMAFAVFTVTNELTEAPGTKLRLMFHGCGRDDASRQIGSTYWGDEGRIECPSGRVISAAFAALSTWMVVQ
jgi:hypothetical protein